MVNITGWYAKPVPLSYPSQRDRYWQLFNSEHKFMSLIHLEQRDEWPSFVRWAKESTGLTDWQAMTVIVETAWRGEWLGNQD